MNSLNFSAVITKAINDLSEKKSYSKLFHLHQDGNPPPSGNILKNIVDLARSALFPGYFGNSSINSQTVKYYIGVNIEHLFDLLSDQILAGLCFGND